MSNITLITQAAEAKFGKVIEFQNDVLLIQREKGLSCAPLDRYMTIKGNIVDGVPMFLSGDYDMSLIAAASNFTIRAQLTDQLEKVEVSKKEFLAEALVEFFDFLEDRINDEITDGEHLSEIVSEDNLNNIKNAFIKSREA